jgi:transposase-like protein
MAGSGKGRYPPEYKDRMVELVRAGRSPGSLAREFEPQPVRRRRTMDAVVAALLYAPERV